MDTGALARLRAYWEELRGDRIAPYRAEIDPRRFEGALENMFILESLNPGQVRVRLGGLALCEMMGMEVRGMPPEAFIDNAFRGRFQEHLGEVLTGPAVAELDLLAEGRPPAGMVHAQMILLPLRSDFGEVTRILGCVVAERPGVRAPVSFRIESARISRVRRKRSADCARSPAEHAAGPLPGFADPADAFVAPPVREVVDNPAPIVSRPRRGHLKVVREV